MRAVWLSLLLLGCGMAPGGLQSQTVPSTVTGAKTFTGAVTLQDQVNLVAGKKICFDGAANCFGSLTSDVNGVITLDGLLSVAGRDVLQTTNASDFSNNGSGLGFYISDAEGLCVGNGTNVQSLPTECDGITYSGMLVSPPQTHNVADNGTGSAPASTLTPTASVILLDYDDATNASVGTISETGARAGQALKVCHTGSGGSVVFTEVGGQQEIGGTACTLNLSDCFEAVYINSSWHFLSCRDN